LQNIDINELIRKLLSCVTVNNLNEFLEFKISRCMGAINFEVDLTGG